MVRNGWVLEAISNYLLRRDRKGTSRFVENDLGMRPRVALEAVEVSVTV